MRRDKIYGQTYGHDASKKRIRLRNVCVQIINVVSIIVTVCPEDLVKTKPGSEGQIWFEMAHNIQWWVLSMALKVWDFLYIHISKPFTIITPSYHLPPSYSFKLLTFMGVLWCVVNDSHGSNIYKYLFSLSQSYSVGKYAMIGRVPVKRRELPGREAALCRCACWLVRLRSCFRGICGRQD
jgi:hypothetical protein